MLLTITCGVCFVNRCVCVKRVWCVQCAGAENVWSHGRRNLVVCVCLCVCARATGHTFWSRNLIFGLSDPWDMIIFSCFVLFIFRNFHFTLFIRISDFFSLYNTSTLGKAFCLL